MKKGSIPMFFLIVVLLMTSVRDVASAQARTGQTDWNLVSQVGGSTQAVAIDGTNLYLGVGWHVEVYDITNPRELVMIGSSRVLPNSIEGLFANGSNYLYAACGSDGLQILDISNPSSPELISSYNTLGYTEDVYVVGNYAILADGPNGIQIIDISDPREPEWVGEAYALAYVYDVEVSETMAFAAAGGSGLMVVDLTYPEQPQEIELVEMNGFVYGLTISENTVYTANAWGGVAVVDITDPINPSVNELIETDGWAMSVAMQGENLLVMDGADGVRLYDISSQTPTLLGIYPDTGYTYQGVLQGENAYVTDKQNGLMIIDLSNPSSPSLAGRYLPILDARRVTMSGSTAYVAAGLSGMRAIDLSDSANPSETYWFDTEAGYANKVIASGNTAYLTTHLATDYSLRIFDISDPLHPEKIGELANDENLFGMAFRSMTFLNDFVYVAGEWSDVAVDVHDPTNPTVTSTLPYENSNTAAFGNLVAMVSSREIRIHDISDPATLQLMSVYERDSAGEGVAFLDQSTIVTSGDNGIFVMDVSDPTNPIERSRMAVPGGIATEIFIEGTTAYITCLGAGIQIIDLSNPDQPELVGEVDTHSIATDCYVSDDLMLVAGSDSGLLIFQRSSAIAANDGLTHSSSETQLVNFEVSPSAAMDTQIRSVASMRSGGTVSEVSYTVQTSNTCTVTTNADDGAGSLRECLATITEGATITFDPQVFPTTNPSTILLNSELPEINVNGITIDASNAGVILDGSQQGSGSGLQLFTSNSKIMGLQIINFPQHGIFLNGENNQIGGNRLNGSAPTGEGNLVSGNAINGIGLGGKNNIVIGNLVGTDVSGTESFPNYVGISLSEYCESTFIGSTIPGEGNVLSGNSYSNLTTWGNRVTIQGNIFGLDINGGAAVKPDTSSNIIIENGACNTLLGGTEAGEGNIISGADIGVIFSDWPTYQNSVIGNYIGTDITGTQAIPNQVGITVFVVSYNRIGGTAIGEANLISGNQTGIMLNGWGASDNIILGNLFGYDSNGNASLPNSTGISIDTGQKHTVIGGYTAAEGNSFSNSEFALRIIGQGIEYTYIAGNNIRKSSVAGIFFEERSSNNYVQGNTFFDMESNAIRVDYGTGNLIRANQFSMQLQDAIFLVEGGNLELAAPVISAADSYSVTGTTCADCLVEVYTVTGDTAIFTGKTIADESGNFLFESCDPLAGEEVVSLAIDTSGNTSAFSNPASIMVTEMSRPDGCDASIEPQAMLLTATSRAMEIPAELLTATPQAMSSTDTA